jgi:hypothetical protein
MSDSLVIATSDLLSLGGNDTLHVSDLNITGAVIGRGTLETYCERLVKTGSLADTVSLVCLADTSSINDAFKAVEYIFEHDPDLLFLVPIALEVPAVKKY